MKEDGNIEEDVGWLNTHDKLAMQGNTIALDVGLLGRGSKIVIEAILKSKAVLWSETDGFGCMTES